MPPEQVEWVKAKCANYERDNFEVLGPKFTSPDGEYSCQMVMIDFSDNVDPIVEAVKQKLTDRSNVGIKKYGEFLGNHKHYNFIVEMQNEALDFVNYCEVVLQKHQSINQIVNKESNDFELGKLIRRIYGN